MNSLKIQETKSNPYILVDCQNKLISLKGASYPENSFEFYEPVKTFIEQCLKKINEINVDLELSYLNSSSFKVLYEIFNIFEDSHNNGVKLNINWTYYEDNDVAEEMGEDLFEDFPMLKINLISKPID